MVDFADIFVLTFLGISVSPLLVTYPTWKEMFGTRPSYDDLLQEIRQFDKTHTAWFISRLNMLLALGRFHSQEMTPIQNLMLGLLVDKELLSKIERDVRQ